jgi:hypothetical protein
VLGCAGGSLPQPSTVGATREPEASHGQPEAPWSSLTPIERVRRSMSTVSLEGAAELAWSARDTAHDSPELRALGARAALAIDCADEAIELAAGTTDPALLRLVVRAHLTRDRWADAAQVAARPELAGDEEAASVVRVAQAVDGLPLWQVSGASCVETTWRADAPVPVVEVVLAGRPVLALLDTTTHVTRVSRALLPDDGVIGALQIGGTTIANVPYFARDLRDAQQTATLPVQVVLGRDVLFRWRVAFSATDGHVVRLGGPGLFHWFDRFQAAAPVVVLDEAPMALAWQRDESHTFSRALSHFVFDSTHRSFLTVAPTTHATLLAPFHGDSFASGPVRLEVWTHELRGDVDVTPALRFPEPAGGVLGWPALVGLQLGWRWMSSLALDFFESDGPPIASDLRPCEGAMRSGPRTWYRCPLEPIAPSPRRFCDPME